MTDVGTNALTGRPALTPAGRFGPAGAPGLASPRVLGNALQLPRENQSAMNPLTSMSESQPPAMAEMPRVDAMHGPEPERSAEGLEDRVSQRISEASPQKLGYEPHDRNDLSITHEAMQPTGQPGEDPRLRAKYEAGIDRMKAMYPHIDTRGLTHQQAAQKFIDHVHDNVVYMWNQVRDKPWLKEAAHWYKGANKYAGGLSQRFGDKISGGLSKRQAAAMIATLSPQTDWNVNVDRVERALEILRDHGGKPFNDEMRQFVSNQIERRSGQAAKDNGRAMLAMIKPNETLNQIRNRPDLDSEHHAYFVRAFDELYHRPRTDEKTGELLRDKNGKVFPDRSYPIISPTGEKFKQAPLASTGLPPKTAWGSFDELADAMQVLKGGDHLSNISRALGMRHKVRNFYNNIVSPDAAAFAPHGQDITIDTHAINAGQMMPMGSKHLYVTHGLGAGIPGMPSQTGAHGLYPLYADAYRKAAKTISGLEGRRYLPREVQSVVWEAVKGMFDDPAHKEMEPEFLNAERTQRNPQFGEPKSHVGKLAKAYFNSARRGILPADLARHAVRHAAGGINDPVWQQLRQQGAPTWD